MSLVEVVKGKVGWVSCDWLSVKAECSDSGVAEFCKCGIRKSNES